MKTSHIAIIAAFTVLGLVGIIVDAPLTATVLVNLIPVIATLSVLAVIYMIAIYFGLEAPRSAFYRMLLGSVTVKVVVGVLIAGIVVASLLGWELPGTLEQRRAFTALLIGVLLTPPIFYAMTIYTGRRDATRQSGDRVLD